MTTLEKEIKEIIEEEIGGKYIGRLKVEEDPIDGEDPLWMLLLYLDLEQTPLIIAYQGSVSQFKNFIRSEVKARQLHSVHFWKAVQELPDSIDKVESYE